jgi:hypothetical protein
MMKKFVRFFIWFFVANAVIIVQIYFLVTIIKANSEETDVENTDLNVYKMTVYSKKPE